MIKVENLQFKYPKSKTFAIKKIDFEIKKGEIFGFLGPSGAGKSTAQKILYKSFGDYTGKVEIEGRDLKEWDKSFFEKVGVSFELPNHYDRLSGRENLDLFASFYKEKERKDINKLFQIVDLEDAIDRPVGEYSKGMKMRLNFIRAIQHDPDILFLDEPTTGLDPVNAQKIRQYILNLKKQGKTIFITTHDMHTVDQICDRVGFIVEGELRIIETPENLKIQHGKKAVSVTLKNKETREFPLRSIGDNQDFLEFIKKGEVLHINTLDASLDEVFIKVTGKALSV
ncbi:ATP-binding protein [Candidatus Parcubacteria bacterium]|nr:MAG: ATP-binding protein [Candidatus Parcubacteria bacterium]